MPITINIYYSGENGNAVKFAKEMISSGIVQAIRQEQGNLRYEYFLPIDSEDTVLLIDSWADQTALNNHHHSPLMAKIAALREKYDLHMRVERYTLSNDEQLTDNKYIRK